MDSVTEKWHLNCPLSCVAEIPPWDQGTYSSAARGVGHWDQTADLFSRNFPHIKELLHPKVCPFLGGKLPTGTILHVYFLDLLYLFHSHALSLSLSLSLNTHTHTSHTLTHKDNTQTFTDRQHRNTIYMNPHNIVQYIQTNTACTHASAWFNTCTFLYIALLHYYDCLLYLPSHTHTHSTMTIARTGTTQY